MLTMSITLASSKKGHIGEQRSRQYFLTAILWLSKQTIQRFPQAPSGCDDHTALRHPSRLPIIVRLRG